MSSHENGASSASCDCQGHYMPQARTLWSLLSISLDGLSSFYCSVSNLSHFTKYYSPSETCPLTTRVSCTFRGQLASKPRSNRALNKARSAWIVVGKETSRNLSNCPQAFQFGSTVREHVCVRINFQSSVRKSDTFGKTSLDEVPNQGEGWGQLTACNAIRHEWRLVYGLTPVRLRDLQLFACGATIFLERVPFWGLGYCGIEVTHGL